MADELYKLLGNKFTFVSTIPMPESFKKAGYPDYNNLPYILNAFEDEKKYDLAMELGYQSELVILGATSLNYIHKRLTTEKITFRYSERIFKKSRWQKFNPRAIIHQYKLHTKFRKKNFYLLCASAFTANDLSWLFAYPNKMFKWGYFTKVEKIPIDKILKEKRGGSLKILFVARLIDWKHPEMAVLLGKHLNKKGVDFEINIVGSGVMIEKLEDLIHQNNLQKVVHLKGNLPNEEVLDLMKVSHIYLFTSDRNEGWGAVANEAMANGCTLVSSNMIGASPFLVEPGQNGMVFRSGSIQEMTAQVFLLAENRDLCEELARNAYNTISKTWSPETAAKRLLDLYEMLKRGIDKIEYEKVGPCSKAFPTPSNWYKK